MVDLDKPLTRRELKRLRDLLLKLYGQDDSTAALRSAISVVRDAVWSRLGEEPPDKPKPVVIDLMERLVASLKEHGEYDK